MTAYFIIQVDVHDVAAFEPYRLKGPGVISQFGGEYIVRGGTFTKLEGVHPLSRQVVIRFPNKESAMRWYESEEYRDLRALRQSCATTNMILVEGVA